MTDLREKIADVLDEWRTNIIDETVAYDWGCYAKRPDSTTAIADRILALLPRMPELRWDEYGTLMLGDPEDGIQSGEVMLNANGTWRGCTSSQWIVRDAATEPEARAAVEAAVRKALGWGE